MIIDHYTAVREGLRRPRHVLARAIEVHAATDGGSVPDWHAHNVAVDRLKKAEASLQRFPRARRSLLDLKVALADQAMTACDLCPRHCLTDRMSGETGFCGVAAEAAVHWEGIVCGEEAELVPSHEVFYSGCTMRCAFCSAQPHVTRPMSGARLLPMHLARRVDAAFERGSTNMNLVGGEPTVHLAHVLHMLAHVDRPAPVVWNSNMYATPVAMRLLDGVVDMFLGDIHFGNDDCAMKIARTPDYMAAITAAFQAAVESGASVIIRHLVIPEHLECCTRPALHWAVQHFPSVRVHVMLQYTPHDRALGDPEIGRMLTSEEIARVYAIAHQIGVTLYKEPSQPASVDLPDGASGGDIGETVEIIVGADGRVGFGRLISPFLPIASSLNSIDPRVVSRLSASRDPSAKRPVSGVLQ